MNKLIEYLEKKIEGCNEIGGMEREKWAFIQCLKEARKQVLNLACVMPARFSKEQVTDLIKECCADGALNGKSPSELFLWLREKELID